MTELAFTDLHELLAALSGPAGATLWYMWVSSWFKGLEIGSFEKESQPIRFWLATRWAKLKEPAHRFFLVTLVSIGIPVAATLVLVYVPVDVIESASLVYNRFSALLVPFLAAQVFYSIFQKVD